MRLRTRSTRRATRSRPIRPRLLTLEQRAVPAAFTVNVLTDTGAGAGTTGDLRYCIAQANDEFNFPGQDTITITATGTITLTGGSLQIFASTIVNGPGASQLTISGNNADRIFTVATNQATTLSKMTMTKGANGAGGGGVATTANNSQLTIADCVITGNTASGGTGGGGGIYVAFNGTLNVLRSTVSNNKASLSGGGIYFFTNGNLNLTECTVSGNVADGSTGGGGVYFFGTVGSNFSIVNSTITGNTATGNNLPYSMGDGGGLQFRNFDGPINIKNSTIVGNTAAKGFGGGISNYYSTGNLSLESTIISGNTDLGGSPDIDSYYSVFATHSLIGVGNAGFAFAAGSTANLTGTTFSPLSAQLGPLQDNGGPTLTMKPLSGSPVIDAGLTPASVSTDQRGQPRLSGPAVDIGSVELQAAAPPTATIKVDDGTAQRSMVQSLTVTFNEPVVFVGTADQAMTLQRTGTGGPVGFVTLGFSPSAGPASVVTITFNDATFAPLIGTTKSLIDGKYTLTLDATQIKSAASGLFFDGDGNGSGGDNLTFNTHRLYGDGNGDAIVSQTDFIAFRNAFNSGPSNTFDYDGSNQVDQADFLQFRNRFNLTP